MPKTLIQHIHRTGTTMSNYPGPSYQGQQPQRPYQGPWQPQQPQGPEPHPQEPTWPAYQPPQQVGTYVPVMYVAKVPGSGVGALTLGIIGLALFFIGVSMPGGSGMFLGYTGILLTFIGLPIAIVTLVRRIRAKPLGVSIAATATNGFLFIVLLIAIIAS